MSADEAERAVLHRYLQQQREIGRLILPRHEVRA
jgi:hypothetical protein